jgi:hypothetical protein
MVVATKPTRVADRTASGWHRLSWQGLVKLVGFGGSELQAMGAVDQPIEDGTGNAGITEQLVMPQRLTAVSGSRCGFQRS